MYMKWVVAVLYCTLLASLATIRTCSNDDFVMHAGAYNHVETIP